MTLKNNFSTFVICFISQSMERTKHGLYVFPPKKTLIWRRHCSIDQLCCSMTSKQFLESSLGMKFVYPSVCLANQNPGAFVSVRYTNQIALFPFVCCFCFVRAFSFQGHTKIALSTAAKLGVYFLSLANHLTELSCCSSSMIFSSFCLSLRRLQTFF